MATIAALSPSFADVSAAVGAAASSGDTVTVPEGEATWASSLAFSKNIIWKALGEGVTIINGIAGGSSRAPLLNITTLADAPSSLIPTFRMTGFTFQRTLVPGVQTAATNNGEIRIAGDCHHLRIDNCVFDQMVGTMVSVSGYIWGVIDNCDFIVWGNPTDANGQPMSVKHPIAFNAGEWNGGERGSGSWAEDPFWGTEKFVFLEDCALSVTAGGSDGIDSFEAARFVVRYCNLSKVRLVLHGTEGQGRGAKQVEEYNNTFDFTGIASPWGQIRSGCIISHDNTVIGVNSGHSLQAFRLYKDAGHWGTADGETLWDKRLPRSGPNGYWATGTHSGATGQTLIDPNTSKTWWDASGVAKTENWSTNRWVENGAAYMIRNITQEATGATVRTWATAHTGTTITCADIGTGADVIWNTGDTYEIWKVSQAFDQPGMGKSDIAPPPGDWPVPTPFDPNQVQEPCYAWNNIGANTALVTEEPQILEGRDFFNRAPQSGDSIFPYTPFTYPHPLREPDDPPPIGGAQLILRKF